MEIETTFIYKTNSKAAYYDFGEEKRSFLEGLKVLKADILYK